MKYEKLIRKLTKQFDLESEVQRKAAFQKCMDFTSELTDPHEMNPFLKEAAELLNQPMVLKNYVFDMTPRSGTEKVLLSFSKEEGPELHCNKTGLLFLSKLFSNLSESKLPGEHVHLMPVMAPMSGRTYPLTVSCEEDATFVNVSENAVEETAEPIIEKRNIAPDSVRALVFLGAVPPTLQLTSFRPYRVTSFLGFDGQQVWQKQIRSDVSRFYVFALIDDTSEELKFALDLDDKDILFITDGDIDRICNSTLERNG